MCQVLQEMQIQYEIHKLYVEREPIHKTIQHNETLNAKYYGANFQAGKLAKNEDVGQEMNMANTKDPGKFSWIQQTSCVRD